MKIVIVADTHRNHELLSDVVDWCIEKHRISMLFHLGDDYDDVVGLAGSGLDIIQVPGIYDRRYLSGELEAKVIESVSGLRIMMVHSLEKDFSAADRNSVDVVLHAHTHRAEIKINEGRLYLNPGHLKSERDKNMAPSFGILEVQDRNVYATIFDLSHAVVNRMELVRSENGLYKVS